MEQRLKQHSQCSRVVTCRGDLLTFDMEEVRLETILQLVLQLGICASTEMVRDRGNSRTDVMHWREGGRRKGRFISVILYLE